MAKIDSTFVQSNRIRKFRNDLVKAIPRIPNNRESLSALRSKHLTELLIIYMCWRLRNVAIRPRIVKGLSALEDDPRADRLKVNITAFTRAVKAGADLGPFLSREARGRGYVMAADPALTSSTTWTDKDFLLNVMGLHHFHVGLRVEPSGIKERTDEVIFAYVTRDAVEVLGLFDHSVFDFTNEDPMTPERERLWAVRDAFRAREASPGAVYLDGYGGMGITTAGTPTMITMRATQQGSLIRDIDPRLDDFEYVKTLFAGHDIPRKVKLEWHYQDMDFGVLSKSSGHFRVLMRGPN